MAAPTQGRAAAASALPWIDALRGLAILMVLANHVALVVPGLSAPMLALARFGQMGVQLFFVASAYTLCLSWQQRRTQAPQPVLGFLLRRLFRIAPLYWSAIGVFGALHWLQPGAQAVTDPAAGLPVDALHDALHVAVRDALANALFLHGFVASAQNSVVPGGWSIGVEMAFYALFPWLMHLQAGWARRSGARAGTRPDTNTGPALLGAGIALAVNLALQAALLTAAQDPGGAMPANNSFGYFHPLNQLPVFLLGIALFQWQHGRRAPPMPRTAAALAGLMLMATAALWRSGAAWAFAVVPSAAGLAFVALAHAASGLHRTPAWLQALGRVSYPVYIVHLLFAWFGLRALAGRLPASMALHGDIAFLVALAAVTLLSWGAAWLLAQAIERPGINLGRRVIAALPGRRPAGASMVGG
jgi:peptidoglycan/LPS O-acetylase OafA/YrhL